jgi:hypothetical protein
MRTGFDSHPNLSSGTVHDEICVCGHPQSLHRTYGCNGSRPNPDPKKTDRVFCQCKEFQKRKAAHG